MRNAGYDAGWLRARRLAGPVVSVGNQSAGGSGKTPFVILLGELLKQRGVNFDVLSRGYGRRTRGVLEVVPEGAAAKFGDEPLLIVRRLGVPVVVGEDRFEAGRFAESKFGAQMHLLDDGFQHRGLARDFDIVMLAEGDLQDELLPGGRLREPLAGLRRANAVVLDGGMQAPLEAEGKLLWRVNREIELVGLPARPVVFCGIARPERFAEQLRRQGVEPAAERRFKDHHAYSEEDVESLLALKKKSGGGGFVTTEKDEINLGGFKSILEPLAVARVKMELENASEAVDRMLEAVAKGRTSS